MSLHEIRPGQSARIAHVGGERSFRRRLMELGFLPGRETLAGYDVHALVRYDG